MRSVLSNGDIGYMSDEVDVAYVENEYSTHTRECTCSLWEG